MKKRKGTLCWGCKNAGGGCSWSQAGIPVKGWGAEPTVIKTSNNKTTSSYCVKSCPLFIKDKEQRKHKTAKEIATELGISLRTVARKGLVHKKAKPRELTYAECCKLAEEKIAEALNNLQ